MKRFISAKDAGDIDELIDLAITFKKDPFSERKKGRNKRIGCIFLNPSMRTRLSTQVAAQNLGMEAIVFNAASEGWALEFEEDAVMNGKTVEHIKDAAPIFGKYFDILAVRTFPALEDREEDYSEKLITQFEKYSGLPVISLESATLHPLQSLADLVTIKETMKKLQKKRPRIVLTWAPHIKPLPQCVPNSFAQWINAWGRADLVIAHPPGYELSKEFTQDARITNNQDEALADADFVYVKNWSSYEHYGQILNVDEDWMLTKSKLSSTKTKVMHCLPVRRNFELSAEVLDSESSIITQQAGNRTWAAQAVISSILDNIK